MWIPRASYPYGKSFVCVRRCPRVGCKGLVVDGWLLQRRAVPPRPGDWWYERGLGRFVGMRGLWKVRVWSMPHQVTAVVNSLWLRV